MIDDIQIGDVLRLPEDLGEIPAGLWIVQDMNFLITLSRAGENEDGDICTTCRLVRVTYHELPRFEAMHLNVEAEL